MSLKKLTLLLLVAGLFVNSFAILLVVDEDGLGMDFATIGDALETAEKGDTIIITKKHTGDWHEDIVIDKGLTLITQDLTIKNWGTITINTEDTVIIDSLTNIGNLSYTDGAGGGALLISDLLLTGSITYNAQGAKGLMQVSNASISGSISTGAATADSNVVRILSSTIGNITTVANYKLELYNSRALQIAYTDGDVIGNVVSAVTLSNGGSEAQTKIIGNLINSVNANRKSIQSGAISKNIKISNNKFTVNSGDTVVYSIATKSVSGRSYYTKRRYYFNGGTTTTTYSASLYNSSYGSITYYDTTFTSGGGDIISLSPAHTGMINVEHNLFNNYGGVPGAGMRATLSESSKLIFNHNFFDNPSTTKDPFGHMLNATGGFVTANYNFGDKNYASVYQLSGVTDQKGNNKNDTVTTDKGNPDPYYNDIDGTRANVGSGGGPYPYSTFDRAGRIADATLRKPLVMWVEAPRKIRPGQKIEIKATGIAF